MSTLQEQHALMARLQASHDPAAQQDARQLQGLYHDQQMAVIAADVYPAMTSYPPPPPEGWMRASEHLDQLRQAMPGLNNLSNKELLDRLRPDSSGFRAEIYLPDPAVLGPGYKPTLVFKGSTGEIVDSHGRTHESATEDFLANNFPQSVGLKTDYYDRAMGWAVTLKKAGADCELAGHSLAGGMASAASAVSGYRATTYNAAGLHPDTATRYAQEHAGVKLYDVSQSVTAYQVQGEMLNNGVQENVHRLDAFRRTQLGGVLKEAAEVMREVPQARDLLERQVMAQLPLAAQATAHAFIDKVATGDTERMLRELPLAAGKVQPLLAPMTIDGQGQLMARENQATLYGLSTMAGPALTALHIASLGEHVGRRAGEGVRAAGQVMGRSMEWAGETVRTVGDMQGRAVHDSVTLADAGVVMAVHQGSRLAAGARNMAGEVGATLDEVQGRVQAGGARVGANALRGVGSMLPEVAASPLRRQADALEQSGEQARLQQQREANATRQLAHAESDGMRAMGQTLERGVGQATQQVGDTLRAGASAPRHLQASAMQSVGQGLRQAADAAPAVGGAAGLVVGGMAGVAWETGLSPSKFSNLTQAVQMGAQFSGGGESLQRHVMPTVKPSLDARIQQQETRAQQVLNREPHIQSMSASPVQDTLVSVRRMLAAASSNDWESMRREMQPMVHGASAQHMRSQAVATVDHIEHKALAAQLQQQPQQQGTANPATSRGASL